MYEVTNKTFLNPKYVFMPINEGFKLRVKDNDYVYKNDIVAIDKTGGMVFSSVSGRVLGVKDMDRIESHIPSLVIENDFKENIRIRKSARKFLNNIKKTDILRSLEDAALTFKGEKVSTKIKKEADTLLINGIDLEPEFNNKYYLFKDNIEDLLETIDLIGNLIKAKRIVIAIKSSESDIISEIVNSIGTYPNIELKLMGDEYPNGHPLVLKKKLNLKDASVFDIEEIYDIREVLKRDMPITEKYISVVGDGVSTPGVIKVKLGSLLSEVFVLNFDFSMKNVDVYLNGCIHGEKVESLKYVVDENIDGLYVTKRKEKKVDACINCGICSKKCPMGLNPKYVFDHKGNVRKEYVEDCIECGLCRHVCPSNIDLKYYMSVRRKRDEK